MSSRPASLVVPRTLFQLGLFAMAAAGATIGADTSAVAAEVWPTRPITLVLPFPPGGPADTLGRQVKDRIGNALGQPILILNQPGGGTVVAANAVKNAAPDGYTLLLGTSTTLVTNIYLNKNATYVLADFEPVALLGRQAITFGVTKSLPITTPAALAAYGKANPGALTYGVIGIGTMVDLAARSLFADLGITVQAIPYKGTQEATVDLLGGRISMVLDSPTTAAAQHNAGRLTVIGHTGSARISSMPDVPTFTEAGYPRQNTTIWFAIVGPKGISADIVTRLNQAINAAMESPAAREQMTRDALEPGGGTPQQVARFLKDENERWGPFIRAQNIQPE